MPESPKSEDRSPKITHETIKSLRALGNNLRTSVFGLPTGLYGKIHSKYSH
jgi:hypothetical protein